MKRTVNVTRNKFTITVKVDGYTESFDSMLMNRSEAYERIKWIAITAGANLNDESVILILREVYDAR